MKYIKHELHGILPVSQVTEEHKAQGWKEITAGDLVKECSGKDVSVDAVPEKVEDMTKKQLEAYARDFKDKAGNIIELDRRMSHKNMLKDFNEQLGD